jgi:hypothetical protein
MCVSKVTIIKEVYEAQNDGWMLCLQWCRYGAGDGHIKYGYRFIWRRPDNSLQTVRAQSMLPSLGHISRLMEKSENEGWGGYNS